MHFSSSVDVIIDEKNELFNAFSIYVPMSLAAANIVDFDSDWVSASRPAVMTCTLNNYKKVMKGRLLDQWQDVFRQDTNVDVILYVIVFLDDESTADMWEIDDVSIKFKPLTDAFNKLFFISYIKVLFDETYEGKPVILPPVPGTSARAIYHAKYDPAIPPYIIPAGAVCAWNDGVTDWSGQFVNALDIAAGGIKSIEIAAVTPGSLVTLGGTVPSPGNVIPDVFFAGLPGGAAGLSATVQSAVDGTDEALISPAVPAEYSFHVQYTGTNTGALAAGQTFSWNDGFTDWEYVTTSDMILTPGFEFDMSLIASKAGVDNNLMAVGETVPSEFADNIPGLGASLDITVTSVTQGQDEVVAPATSATAIYEIAYNPAPASYTVPAGTICAWDDGVKEWAYVFAESKTVTAGDNFYVEAAATTAGIDNNLADGAPVSDTFFNNLPDGFSATIQSFTQGTDYIGPTEGQSPYFDYSLALAYLCKLDNALSYFVSLVKVSYIDQKPNPLDPCHIRLRTPAEEKEAMISIADGDRAKYYWGALFLMNCVQNTWVLVHSEPVNIIPLIFAAWFGQRNASGQYIGNKLSLLRLRGARIKPLGFPSWLNSEVNENDADGFNMLDEKKAGFLSTIADNTPQESCVSSARSLSGLPLSAQMISKFADYTSRQQCAKLITDDGTLIDPVLTDEDAYTKIQEIVFGNLLAFVPTRRINNIQMKFPPFLAAKSGLTRLEAASSWKAGYTDDLDEVTVTGGIVAS